jgi:type IV pilus assembly protein PilW
MTSQIAHTPVLRDRSDQAGFTLVEIMVGLTIGMLATLVIMQVFSVFEEQKRATTGTADALTNGNIALYKIGRELQSAGYGLALTSLTNSPLMCPLPMPIDPLVAPFVTSITPVTITDGGVGSDSITIRYGTSRLGGASSKIDSVAGTTVSVASNLGCTFDVATGSGDLSLVVNELGPGCAISRVIAPVVAPPPPAPQALPPLTPIPVPSGTVTLNSAAAVVADGTLACLGEWHEVTYAVGGVAGLDLTRQDLWDASVLPPGVPPPFNPLVANIVNIQAQYGVSATPSSNTVIAWVDATGIWAAPTVINRNRIKSIRIAVVARDPKMETANVTDPCNPAANTGLCAWVGTAGSPAPTIDMSAAYPNWQQYHYRVFETIIPLRNVVLANTTLLP